MELKVNGNPVDITLEGETTVGDVLKAFEEEASRNNATTVNILLNGEDISADKFESALSVPLKADTVLELTVVSQKDITENFLLTAKKFEELSKTLLEVPVMLQAGRDADAGSIIADLAGQIDLFCHTATLSALFPETYSSISVDGKDIGSVFEELAPILADLEGALKDKDTVTVGDLSEYEIAPRLEKLALAVREGLK
ncbi:MAG: hypothetical protein J1F14_07355 [Treponema sp.]|nr:hypothetical protein [Treponema sp.]